MIKVTTQSNNTELVFEENEIFRITQSPGQTGSTLLRDSNVTIAINESPTDLNNSYCIVGTATDGTKILVPSTKIKVLEVDGSGSRVLFLGNANPIVFNESVDELQQQTITEITASNLGAGEAVFAQKVGNDLEFKTLTAGTGITLSGTADNVQITNSSPGSMPETVYVEEAADLPAVLAANTTYIIIGQVTITSGVTVNAPNTAVIGLNPKKDALLHTGTGVMFDIDNVSFKLENIRLESPSTNSTVISATNYAVGAAPLYGRTEQLSLTNVIIQNVYNVAGITGFDIVDLLNVIITNVTGGVGFLVRDVSKLQVTSCEFIRWYDSATGTVFSTATMLDLRSNGPDNVGFGAVNVSGSIFHPQQSQKGIEVQPLSTTGFGTVVSNTFVDTGLTTGVLTDIDVNGAQGKNFVIRENQGLLNQIGLVEMRLSNNALQTSMPSQSTPIQINGGTAFTFPLANRVITSNTGTIEGNLLRPTYFFVNVNIKAELVAGSGNNQTINFYFAVNGTPITFAKGSSEFDAQIPQSLGFSVTGLAQQGDVFSIYVENATSAGTDIIVQDLSLSGFGL